MTQVDELDLNEVLRRLEGKGLGPQTLPFVEDALIRLDEERPDGTPTNLDDLLICLLRMGCRDVVMLLLDEIEGWLKDVQRSATEMPRKWNADGRRPNGVGYGEARQAAIRRALEADNDGAYGAGCGGLDERVVEYPWVFDRLSQLHTAGNAVLDAGSTLNHRVVLDAWLRRSFGPLSIVTLCPEEQNFLSSDVRYEYADLRTLPYRDAWFQSVVCLSTLEHVGMDNQVYGSGVTVAPNPGEEAVRAISEMRRVLSPGGNLLISIPFGRSSDRGWQRIFSASDLEVVCRSDGWASTSVRVFRSMPTGWSEVGMDGAEDAGYNDMHEGGIRDAPEWVAAAEAVAFVEMRKA